MMKRSADEADADAYYHGYNYGSYGYSYPSSFGYNNYGGYPFRAMGKRSADADADAYYGGYNYGYSSFPSSYGPFQYHSFGKRSADAEADAFYAPYGYASPYSQGYGNQFY